MTGNIDDLISIVNADVYCNNEKVTVTDLNGAFDFITEEKTLNLEVRKNNYSKSMYFIDITNVEDTVKSQQFLIYPLAKSHLITPDASKFSIGKYTFNIPEGAVNENIEIEIYESGSNNIIQSDTMSVLFGMEFLPSGTTFEKPITVSFPLPEFMKGNNNDFIPYMFNENTFSYDIYDGNVEVVNDTVYCELNHFSIIWWVIYYWTEWEWSSSTWSNVGDWVREETIERGPYCAGADAERTIDGIEISRSITLTVSASVGYEGISASIEASEGFTWTDHLPNETVPVCKCCTYKYNIMTVNKKRNYRWRYCGRDILWNIVCDPWENATAQKSAYKYTSDTPECEDNTAEECHDQGGGK